MTLKNILDEDFVNYKLPTMTLIFPYCSFKCGKDLCQNKGLYNTPNIEIDNQTIIQRYIKNDITKAICCMGLEPFESFNELYSFVVHFRQYSDDDIVIFTGFDKDELLEELERLSKYENIIVKFGRYVPNQEPHYDEVLGIKLVSDNQYAERIS